MTNVPPGIAAMLKMILRRPKGIRNRNPRGEQRGVLTKVLA
jgi:hypothetical protein